MLWEFRSQTILQKLHNFEMDVTILMVETTQMETMPEMLEMMVAKPTRMGMILEKVLEKVLEKLLEKVLGTVLEKVLLMVV